MNQPPPIPAPLKTAVNNAATATQALNASVAANNQLQQGNNLGANLSKLNKANTTATTALANTAKNIAKSINTVNVNQNRKAQLVIAQKHFTTAAINSSANQPIKAANHARRGVNALKNYIGANM